jgi:hypothetical protein
MYLQHFYQDFCVIYSRQFFNFSPGQKLLRLKSVACFVLIETGRVILILWPGAHDETMISEGF